MIYFLQSLKFTVERSYLLLMQVSALCVLFISVYKQILLIEPRVIDNGLVLSQSVIYESASPMYAYFYSAFNLETVFVAIALKIGYGQELISLFALFVPLALLYFGISNFLIAINPKFVALAVIIPLFTIFSVDRTFAINEYPLNYVSVHSFGVFGIAVATYFIGLMAKKSFFLIGLFIPLLPAVHPVVGIFTLLFIFFIVFIFGASKENFHLGGIRFFINKKMICGIVVGILIVVTSFTIIYLNLPKPTNLKINHQAVESYNLYWDYHRNVHGLSFNYIKYQLILIALAFTLIILEKRECWPLRFYIYLSTGLLLAYSCKDYYPQILVDILFIRMPLIIAPMSAALFIYLKVIVLVRIILYFSRKVVSKNNKNIRWRTENFKWLFIKTIKYNKQIIIIVYIGILLLIQKNSMALFFGAIKDQYFTVTTYNSLNVIQKKESLPLLNGSLKSSLVVTTLSTSRWAMLKLYSPILLDLSGFDFISYLPNTAGSISNIIIEIYGIDFNNPPESIRNTGVIADQDIKNIFTNRSANDWNSLANKYLFNAVIVPSDWVLNIEKKTVIDGVAIYSLYKI